MVVISPKPAFRASQHQQSLQPEQPEKRQGYRKCHVAVDLLNILVGSRIRHINLAKAGIGGVACGENAVFMADGAAQLSAVVNVLKQHVVVAINLNNTDFIPIPRLIEISIIRGRTRGNSDNLSKISVSNIAKFKSNKGTHVRIDLAPVFSTVTNLS